MVETQLKGSTRAHAISTGQEIEADNRLEHRRFTGRLPAEHGNARQSNNLGHAEIAQLIDDIDELSQLLVHEAALNVVLFTHLL